MSERSPQGLTPLDPVVSTSTPSSGEPRSQPLRVLVVDDNEDNRNLLARRLKSKGYIVDLAVDGPSALEACAKITYDALILDVMMPGMSGIEVLTKLRETHGKTELAIIMATAKTDSASVVEALKKGANDHVTKPIDFPVLMARLETHLAMKREAAEAAAAAAAKVDVTFGIAPGTVLAERYEILEKCGEGGFAVVYRARQLSTNRDVALKHLRPDVLGAKNDNVHLERFERETKLIGELNHSHVVRLIDSGSVSMRPGAPSQTQTRALQVPSDAMSVPYLVMELLTGESVGELITREGPLEASRAVDIMLPVLSALHAAHEKGVIHRDVKPNNIMLANDGRGTIEPKVLDFGIAKLTKQGEGDLTVTSSLVGTPRYMPPEQAFGKKDLDARVDQFSAAAVLYEMLAGKPVYAGENYLEVVSNVLTGAYTPLAEAQPGLPPELVAAVTRGLASKRENRYPTVLAFGRAILPFASERGARRWTDEFGAASMGPPPLDATLKDEPPKPSPRARSTKPPPPPPPAATPRSEAPPAPKSVPPISEVKPVSVAAPIVVAPPSSGPPKWLYIVLVGCVSLIVSYLASRYL